MRKTQKKEWKGLKKERWHVGKTLVSSSSETSVTAIRQHRKCHGEEKAQAWQEVAADCTSGFKRS